MQCQRSAGVRDGMQERCSPLGMAIIDHDELAHLRICSNAGASARIRDAVQGLVHQGLPGWPMCRRLCCMHAVWHPLSYVARTQGCACSNAPHSPYHVCSSWVRAGVDGTWRCTLAATSWSSWRRSCGHTAGWARTSMMTRCSLSPWPS